MSKNTYRKGVTLIEIILVVAIIGVFVVLLLGLIWGQVSKGRDARRKSDLESIKVAFEEYYNDNGCYPPEGILDNCGGAELQPYLKEIPCDPSDEQPYQYVPSETNICSGYRVFAQLENETDPVVGELGCTGGCGSGLDASYNYGIAVGLPLSDGDVVEGGGLEGTVYACAPGGACNVTADPSGCPVTFTTPNCDDQCGDTSNWCD